MLPHGGQLPKVHQKPVPSPREGLSKGKPVLDADPQRQSSHEMYKLAFMNALAYQE